MGPEEESQGLQLTHGTQDSTSPSFQLAGEFTMEPEATLFPLLSKWSFHVWIRVWGEQHTCEYIVKGLTQEFPPLHVHRK